MAEYRIEYTIQRAEEDGGEFVDVGFGSSGAWDDVDSALQAASSDIQRREWEIDAGMPDPNELESS